VLRQGKIKVNKDNIKYEKEREEFTAIKGRVSFFIHETSN